MMPAKPSSALSHLLWTGGWDSTFRVLQAVVLEERVVQPHYVVDLRRTGFGAEIRAMADIKRRIAERFPAARDRLLAVEIFQRDDIPENAALRKRFDQLRSHQWLGDQYEWLTRFARWRQLSSLELAIHRDDRAYEFVHSVVERDDDGRYRLRQPIEDPAVEIFEPFVFPILSLTKLDMGRIAAEHRFADILEHTWFCHTPDARGRPCGRCNPCRYTIDEGLARRVPRFNRLKYEVRRRIPRAALPLVQAVGKVLRGGRGS
jgi:hypothetical protein